jgi:glucose/arabinose dehydrogenase
MSIQQAMSFWYLYAMQIRLSKTRLAHFLCGFLALTLFTVSAQAQKKSKSAKPSPYRIDTIARDITIPYGIAFLPDGRMLVTDRGAGKIYVVDKGRKQALSNVPQVHGKDQAGMMDIVLHPDYGSNGWLYYSYAAVRDNENGTIVERAKLKGTELTERQVLFTTHPFYGNGAHYGCRLALKDGYLFLTIGERYSLRDSAQLLGNHLGKVIRIHDDGRVPADNPFFGKAGARPEVWSYGHRNPQGLAFHPETGELWEGEHGPKGGDELNLIRPGLNYGWPVITYGVEYSGATIGDGITSKEGMEQPVKYYKPSIGPSGLLFYTGDAFPAWKGSLFQGALALTHLNRLELRDGKVVQEERLFADKQWRVRSLAQGPDGFLYIGVDGGMVLRIRPAR